MHLAARLRELETEADTVRAELAEMDTLASQTEAAIYRLLSSVLASGNLSLGLPSDAELEAAMRQSPPSYQINDVRPSYSQSNVGSKSRRSGITWKHLVIDLWIEQFRRLSPCYCAEKGAPLHVNELYNRLLEGGFKFTGQNPTISVAVSLNRNTRFRKVAPGTFDLVIRDASKAS